MIVGLCIKFRLTVISLHCLQDLLLSLRPGLLSKLVFAGPLEADNSGSFPQKLYSFTMICPGVDLLLFILLNAQSALSTQGFMFFSILENLNCYLFKYWFFTIASFPSSRTLIRQMMKPLNLFSVTLNCSFHFYLLLSVLCLG